MTNANEQPPLLEHYKTLKAVKRSIASREFDLVNAIATSGSPKAITDARTNLTRALEKCGVERAIADKMVELIHQELTAAPSPNHAVLTHPTLMSNLDHRAAAFKSLIEKLAAGEKVSAISGHHGGDNVVIMSFEGKNA